MSKKQLPAGICDNTDYVQAVFQLHAKSKRAKRLEQKRLNRDHREKGKRYNYTSKAKRNLRKRERVYCREVLRYSPDIIEDEALERFGTGELDFQY